MTNGNPDVNEPLILQRSPHLQGVRRNKFIDENGDQCRGEETSNRFDPVSAMDKFYPNSSQRMGKLGPTRSYGLQSAPSSYQLTPLSSMPLTATLTSSRTTKLSQRFGGNSDSPRSVVSGASRSVSTFLYSSDSHEDNQSCKDISTPSMLFHPSPSVTRTTDGKPSIINFGGRLWAPIDTQDVSDISENFLTPRHLQPMQVSRSSAKDGNASRVSGERNIQPMRVDRSSIPLAPQKRPKHSAQHTGSLGLMQMKQREPIVNEGNERTSKSDTESSVEFGETLMLRNIPNKYTRDMILEEIHEAGFALDVDFLYMPIDLRFQHGVGYCFVNLASAEAAQRFRQRFHHASSKLINSGKVFEVSTGKVQGLAANIEAYRNSAVMTMKSKFHPVLLKNGEPIPFPAPTMTKEELRKLRHTKKSAVSARDVKRKDQVSLTMPKKLTKSTMSGSTEFSQQSQFSQQLVGQWLGHY